IEGRMIRIQSGMAFGIAMLCAAPVHAQLPTQKVLPISLANEAAMAALASCVKSGYKVNVVIVDRHGDVRVHLVGDNAIAANDTGRRKAYTAAIRGTSSADYGKLAAGRPPPGPGTATPDPNLITAAGGLPIVVDGDVIAG